MRKLRSIGTAITTTAALSAIIVSMASAAEPEFKPAKGTFTIKSGAGTLEVGGTASTVCKKDKGSGEITGAKEVSLVIAFEECTVLSIIDAHSLGDPANVILLQVFGELGFINSAKEEVGILLAPTGPVHIEAASTLEVVSGVVVGKVEPLNKKQTTGKIVLPKTALTCEGELDNLVASENEGATKGAAEITTEELTFNEATEVTG